MPRRLLALGTLIVLGFFPSPRMAAASEVKITLNWTTPGDDGWVGRASHYDVRVSRAPINEGNFHRAGKVAGFLTPGPSGRVENMVVTGLTAGVDYYFAIKTRDERGNWSPISNVVLWSNPLLDAAIATFALDFSSARPNPAQWRTRFDLMQPVRDRVRVEAFDLTGRRVRTLVNDEERIGATDVTWNLADDWGARVPPGVYLVRAQVGKTAFTRRVSVIR